MRFVHPQAPKIHAHFAERMGCSVDDILRPGTTLAVNEYDEQLLIVVWELAASSVLQVPPRLEEEVREAIGRDFSSALSAMEVAQRLEECGFAGVQPIPSEQVLFLNPAAFQPVYREGVRQLTSDDAAALTDLHRRCPAIDQRMADINIEQPAVFGCYAEGRLAAVASFIFHGDEIADVGVLCDPEFRRRGLAQAAVSALCEWGLQQDRIVQYWRLDANLGSARLAERLNFMPYTRQTVLRVT